MAKSPIGDLGMNTKAAFFAASFYTRPQAEQFPCSDDAPHGIEAYLKFLSEDGFKFLPLYLDPFKTGFNEGLVYQLCPISYNGWRHTPHTSFLGI